MVALMSGEFDGGLRDWVAELDRRIARTRHPKRRFMRHFDGLGRRFAARVMLGRCLGCGSGGRSGPQRMVTVGLVDVRTGT